MAARTTWDVSNLKAVQIDIDKFGHGKVRINGVEMSEEIEVFKLTCSIGHYAEIEATLVQPPAAEEKDPLDELVDALTDMVGEVAAGGSVPVEVEPPEIVETVDISGDTTGHALDYGNGGNGDV